MKEVATPQAAIKEFMERGRAAQQAASDQVANATPTPPPAAHINLTARMIDVVHIAESATNPRRTYDAQKMKELTDSIRHDGVQQPVVVRAHPHPKGVKTFELVVGSRRLRATIAAGLQQIPCVVRELTDLAVVKIQLIENAQREDVHPIEEGHGYRQLMKLGNYTAEQIAEETGKDVTYVYRRIRLLELTPELQQLFLDNKIILAHALPLSRLAKADQEWAHAKFLIKTEEFRRGHAWVKEKLVVTPHELNKAIEQHLLRPLSGVIWSLDDAELLPKAGACLTCPKRSSAQAALFDAGVTKGDRCLDSHCYEAKREAFFQRKITAFKAEGVTLLRATDTWTSGNDDKAAKLQVSKHESDKRVKPGDCDSIEHGIIVHGDKLGQTITFCRNEKCKVHNRVSSSGRSLGEIKPFADVWKTKRENLALKIETEVRREVTRQVAAKARPGKAWGEDIMPQMDLVFARLMMRLDNDSQRELCMTLGLEPGKVKSSWGSQMVKSYSAPVTALYRDADAAHRIELLVATAICQTGPGPYSNKCGLPEAIAAAAKQFRVDAARVEKTIAAPLRASLEEQFKRAKKKNLEVTAAARKIRAGSPTPLDRAKAKRKEQLTKLAKGAAK